MNPTTSTPQWGMGGGTQWEGELNRVNPMNPTTSTQREVWTIPNPTTSTPLGEWGGGHPTMRKGKGEPDPHRRGEGLNSMNPTSFTPQAREGTQSIPPHRHNNRVGEGEASEPHHIHTTGERGGAD